MNRRRFLVRAGLTATIGAVAGACRSTGSPSIGSAGEWDEVRERSIVATPTPYAQSHARISPSIRNSPQEIDTALSEIRALA